MPDSHSYHRTCTMCGSMLAPTASRCPACNRDLPPIKAQLVILAIGLSLFLLFCALLYLSARRGVH